METKVNELIDQARALSADAAELVQKLEAKGLDVAMAVGDGVSPFVFRLMIFVIAIFVGYYVVWSVTPALHTPLMSVTNAISSVIAVGAIMALGAKAHGGVPTAAWTFGFFALMFASVNIFGGFLVTRRMLDMYKPKERKS